MTKDTSEQLNSTISVGRRTVLSALSGVALGTVLPVRSSAVSTTDEHQEIQSVARLTPRPAETDVGGMQSLSGTWDFTHARTENPPKGSAGKVTPDLSGAGNDGTLGNDPSIVTDPSEQALDLTDKSHVAVGDADSLDFTTPGFTVEVTFKYAGDGPIFSKGGKQYSLGVWNGTLSFWTKGEGSWPGVDAGDLSLGQWYTATLVVDESEIRLSVNGSKIGSTSHEFSSLPSTDSPLHLGYDAGNNDYGSPVVDSLRVLDEAISADWIGWVYDSVPDSAVAWLPIDSASNGITPDVSGMGNDGVLRNSPVFVPGRYGRGLDLSGNGYVSAGAAESLNFTSPGFTFRTTIRYDGGGGVVLDKGTTAISGGTEQFGLGVYDGVVSFWMQTADGNWPTVQGGDLSSGEWYTITAVVTDSEARLYVDGTQVGTVSHQASELVSSDARFVIGGNNLDFTVKSAKAFDTVLDADRIDTGFLAPPGSAVLWHTYNTITDLSVEWHDESVPGQWGYDGYFVPDGAADWYPPRGVLGWYRREFEVPDGWADGRLRLRFDAVYSHARVFINGTQVTEHVGGYTPFEVDITDVVDADGINTLAVGISQRSKADDMAWQNVTGGIPRDVTLLSVPESHLSDCTVRTALSDDGSSATVSVHTTVQNAGERPVNSGTVIATLTDPDEETVGSVKQTISTLSAGASQDLILEFEVSDPLTWNPEQPRLHTVDVELRVGETTERVTERVGIRTVEIDGNDLRVNGEAVTLRGVNWEEIHLPEYGHAVPSAITREDARRLKEANVNYVRTAHHPTSEAFLEATDELGIIVEIEAPHTFLGGHRGDPSPEIVVRQTLEMVERDKNRTSVCIWSLANESSWYDVFDTAAQLVKEADPTRPIIFNTAEYSAEAPWHDSYDLGAHHYPAFRTGSTVEQYADLNLPILFDEYAHLYCYNDRELVTDPGLRDQWGRAFERIWNQCREADSVAGAALWAGGDHLEQWGEYYWGMLDRNRRLRPEYWHVKKMYAPVEITETKWNGKGRVTVTIENRHEFVNLSERTITVEHLGKTEERTLDAAPGEQVTTAIVAGGDDVHLTVTHPEGHTINEFTLSPERESSDELSDSKDPEVTTTDGSITVKTDDSTLRVDRTDGTLAFSSADGKSVLANGPDLALTPTQDSTGRKYATIIDHRPSGRRVTDVSLADDGSTIAIDVEYDRAEGTFSVRPLAGGLAVSYEFTLVESISVREVGITLPAATDLTTLSWDRNGKWTTYPSTHIGRKTGNASAFPDGFRPDHEGIKIRTGQSWKHDTTWHGSNDFRSTKRNVIAASLTDSAGRGIHVVSNGSQHVRAQVRSESVDLLVLDRSLSGTNADGWLSRHPVLNEEPVLDAGKTLEGSATVGLASVLPPVVESGNDDDKQEDEKNDEHEDDDDDEYEDDDDDEKKRTNGRGRGRDRRPSRR